MGFFQTIKFFYLKEINQKDKTNERLALNIIFLFSFLERKNATRKKSLQKNNIFGFYSESLKWPWVYSKRR